ncbi:hypothetical protein PRIPAC_94554 [Pristionchus pacificus]|uniref:Uncharacterized protein n=1 Tax=Pristionchus pacificus TaxID=54126 RepID=A0A2A6CDM1_PRIPA|nr:hypothetical protein PRIPAC_94554 [Pristionchus pacificus]|eukprot:PDM76294.1 hypothetical protein PRIPAC_39898 [Pristionchus pacificus]
MKLQLAMPDRGTVARDTAYNPKGEFSKNAIPVQKVDFLSCPRQSVPRDALFARARVVCVDLVLFDYVITTQ